MEHLQCNDNIVDCTAVKDDRQIPFSWEVLTMVDDIDELTILVLNTAGRNEAIALYEEEAGCSHAESVQAVEDLSHRAGIHKKAPIGRRIGTIVCAILTLGTLVLLAAKALPG
jgi:hypothetical protein